MTGKTRNGRRCTGPDNEGTVAPVPGLTQVLEAIDLLLSSDITRVNVSIASGSGDSELIALSQEAAEQSGIDMDVESQRGTLTIRLSRERRR